MLVFWDQRLAFVATPKTGSTAIAAALGPRATISVQQPPVLKHTTAFRYHRFIGPYLAAASGQEFELCALMREPRDWLASWFRYRRRPEVPEAKSTRGRSFDDFVRAWCSDPQPDFAAVGSQAQFLRARNGRGVDHLFRYEDTPAFLAFLEARLGGPIALPRLNVSPPAETGLSPATEALLRRTAAADFALYEGIGRSGGMNPALRDP